MKYISASIHSGAQFAGNVEVGVCFFIGEHVDVDAAIGSHVEIEACTHIGRNK